MATLIAHLDEDGYWRATADVEATVTHVVLFDAADHLPASHSVQDVEKWLAEPEVYVPVPLESSTTLGAGQTLKFNAQALVFIQS